jgi:hypothetical protein
MEWRLAHGGEGPVGAKRELIASETKEELGSMAVDAYVSKEQMLQELGGLLEAAAEDARGGVAEEAREEAARLREEQRPSSAWYS